MTEKLDYTRLKRIYSESEIVLEKPDDIERIIGQAKGAEAIKFGLSVKNKGYNIYVCGVPGCGKTSFAKHFAQQQAKNEPAPPDLAYIYNFKNPKEPVLLTLEAGKGRELKDDMEELIQVLSVEMPKAFSGDEYEAENARVMKKYQEMRDDAVKELTKAAKDEGFSLKFGNSGVYFLPIVDGKAISENEYDELGDEEKEEIAEESEDIQNMAADTMRLLRSIDKRAKEEAETLDYNIAMLTVGRFMSAVLEKYVDNEIITDYLLRVKEDIISNISDFTSQSDGGEDDQLGAMMPWMAKRPVDENYTKYRINLITDNSGAEHAPVIVNFNPTYTNLVGEIEYDTENGNFVTDFTKIKGGLIHKANGGYLILQVTDLLSSPFAWETLRRVLKTGEVTIEPLREYQIGGIAVTGMRPQPAKVNVKVVLIGTNYYMELLNEYDDEFSKLFKICAMFDYEMDGTSENMSAMASFIKKYANKHGAEIDMPAILEVFEYSQRLAQRQDKLTVLFGRIGDLLTEAQAYSNGKIDKSAVEKAIAQKNERVDLYQKKYLSMILDDEIMIATEGKRVGEINGLCVMETNGHAFGLPTKITASTYMGKAGVVNIEKEAEMSGNIHDKGVQVITGFLGETFAQNYPLTLSCRICFEQSYNGVDGDSASSTELYAIISSLSGVPIDQRFAVTGSVNQKGVIQPIGGATEKIEGFFEICKQRGFKNNAVIIPKQNVRDLVLKDEVIEAVKDGKFSIYAIEHINEGIELLMGKKAGKKNEKGNFPRGSVNYLASKKLKDYHGKSEE